MVKTDTQQTFSYPCRTGCFVGEAVFVPRWGPSTLEGLCDSSSSYSYGNGNENGNGIGNGTSATNGNSALYLGGAPRRRSSGGMRTMATSSPPCAPFNALRVACFS